MSYIYIYMELLVKPEMLTSYIYMDLRLATLKQSLSICCTMFQHWINAERFPVSHLCVNTLPASWQSVYTPYSVSKVAILPYQNESANGNKSDALHNASIMKLKPNSPDLSQVSNGFKNWKLEPKIEHSQRTKEHKAWHSIFSDIYDYTDQATNSIWHKTFTKYSHPLWLLTFKIQTLMTKLLMSSFVQMNGKRELYEGWNFNSGNYLFITDTK